MAELLLEDSVDWQAQPTTFLTHLGHALRDAGLLQPEDTKVGARAGAGGGVGGAQGESPALHATTTPHNALQQPQLPIRLYLTHTHMYTHRLMSHPTSPVESPHLT